jgi:hypothetical protein
VALPKTQLVPALSRHFEVELYSAGDQLTPVTADAIKADASRTDLGGALRTLRKGTAAVNSPALSCCLTATTRYRPAEIRRPPVMAVRRSAVGIGSTDGLRDRELLV